MEGWNDFFVAILGAAAALTGLIFVGVSISLSKILSIAQLPSRAAESLILLINVLIVSALCLVPKQPVWLIGTEILLLGIITWVITFRIDILLLRDSPKEYKRHYRQNMLFTQLALLPYIVSGAIVLSDGVFGLYFLVQGILFSFIKSVIDAWVLLVEINR